MPPSNFQLRPSSTVLLCVSSMIQFWIWFLARSSDLILELFLHNLRCNNVSIWALSLYCYLISLSFVWFGQWSAVFNLMDPDSPCVLYILSKSRRIDRHTIHHTYNNEEYLLSISTPLGNDLFLKYVFYLNINI